MATMFPEKGRGCGKRKALSQEQRRLMAMLEDSVIRRYENGYVACYIDRHPHGSMYRDPHNQTGVSALPAEQIMLLNRCGIVVVFLEAVGDLDRMEKELHLKRKI